MCPGVATELKLRKSKPKPAEWQHRFKFLPLTGSAGLVRALVGGDWVCTWHGVVTESPTEAEDFEASDSQTFISLEEVVSPLLAENVSIPYPTVVSSCLHLPKGINLSLPAI